MTYHPNPPVSLTALELLAIEEQERVELDLAADKWPLTNSWVPAHTAQEAVRDSSTRTPRHNSPASYPAGEPSSPSARAGHRLPAGPGATGDRRT